ncbi:MAG: FHA domain-containing protein [Akkermansiaceae bacterium]
MPRVTISEPGKTPQPYRFKLERKVVKIGRSSESDIIIECGSASTNHCTMERVEGGYILRDNGSTNGIKQEDTLMDIIDLFDGMEVLIGDVPMKFQLSESEIEIIAEEEFSTHQKKKLPKNKDEETDSRPVATTASPRASHSPRPAPKVQSSSAPVSFFLVFILMIVGIVVGMTLRHYRETGDFLISKWVHGAEEKVPEAKADTEEKKPGEGDGSATPAE